jgi:hypothetical protein
MLVCITCGWLGRGRAGDAAPSIPFPLFCVSVPPRPVLVYPPRNGTFSFPFLVFAACPTISDRSLLFCQLDEILRLEEERKHYHLWTPVSHIFKWNDWHFSEGPNEDEEDPNTVQGLEPAVMDDLGIARRRDPDYLPPRNAFEWAMSHLFGFFESFKAGNALYAVKAGLLTGEFALLFWAESADG